MYKYMNLEDKKYWENLIKFSLSKFFILLILDRCPGHGYEISKKVKDFTCGCCSPTEGTLYPTLNALKKEGYLRCKTEDVKGRKRKIYTLNRKGKKVVKVAIDSWKKIIPLLHKICCCPRKCTCRLKLKVDL